MAGLPKKVRIVEVGPNVRAPAGAGPVLFSPACASFDAYANFRARALAFRAALPDADGPTP